MDKAQVLERVAFKADDQAAEVTQPGEEPFDLPAAPRVAEWTTIVGLGTFAVAAVWGDQLDAPRRQGPRPHPGNQHRWPGHR